MMRHVSDLILLLVALAVPASVRSAPIKPHKSAWLIAADVSRRCIFGGAAMASHYECSADAYAKATASSLLLDTEDQARAENTRLSKECLSDARNEAELDRCDKIWNRNFDKISARFNRPDDPLADFKNELELRRMDAEAKAEIEAHAIKRQVDDATANLPSSVRIHR